MNSLSTAYPQVMHWFNILLTVYYTAAPIVLFFYFKRLFLQDFPGKRTINALRTECAEFSGMVGDLTDRFARFQNKEGMRAARDKKEQDRSVLEHAQEIASQAAPDEPGKAGLYRRRSRLQ